MVRKTGPLPIGRKGTLIDWEPLKLRCQLVLGRMPKFGVWKPVVRFSAEELAALGFDHAAKALYDRRKSK